MMKQRKLETVRNLIRHKAANGTYIMDLTENRYYHELNGQQVEITEDQFTEATAGDNEINFNLTDPDNGE